MTKPGLEDVDVRTSPRTTRAAINNVKHRLSQGEDNKMIDGEDKICVSARGVLLSKDTMMKKYMNRSSQLSSKKKKKNTEDKKVKTTPSANKISQYLVKKSEDKQLLKTTEVQKMIDKIEDKKETLVSKKTETEMKTTVKDLKKIFDVKDVKTTFSDINDKKNVNIQKKILSFQEVSDKGDTCLFGSGRCAKHNTKLVREVTNKRVSVITKEGSLGWKMSEGTILVCPAVRRIQSERGNTVQPDVMLSANKRARICEKEKEPIKSEIKEGAIVKTDDLKQ